MIWKYIGLSGWGAAIVLFLLLFAERQCSHPAEPATPAPKIIVKIDTVFTDTGKTIPMPYAVPGEIVYRDGKRIQLPPTHADTLAILANCAAQRVYNEPVKTKSGKVIGTVTDTIQDNRRKSLTIRANIPDSMPLVLPRTKVFAGIFLGFDTQIRPSAGISISVLNKKDQLYSVNFDALNKITSVSMYWKIHF